MSSVFGGVITEGLKKLLQPTFNIKTVEGRQEAMRFIYLRLPWDVFKQIFSLILQSSPFAIHPITLQLVERRQLKLHRGVFFKYFRDGPEAAILLWDKNLPDTYRHKFCRRCGETPLTLSWNCFFERCTEKGICKHPHGNYICSRIYNIMGSMCYYCLKHYNVVDLSRFDFLYDM